MCILFIGSKSDGQRSPNDTVFLRMEEIPYIHEDRPDFGEDGEYNTHALQTDRNVVLIYFGIVFVVYYGRLCYIFF